MTNEAQLVIEELFGRVVWLTFAYLVISVFKGLILNVYEGLMVFIGGDFDADDVVYVGADERPARIVRMGIRKTDFYMKDLNGEWNIKMVVPNERLKNMVLKKTLPKNGGKFHTKVGEENAS